MTVVAQSPPPLQAGSLSLRAPAMTDLPALTAVWGDPRVARYWTGDPLSADECRAKLDGILAANAAGDCLQWGVSTEPTGALIGTCTIWKIDRGQRRAELGIAIEDDASSDDQVKIEVQDELLMDWTRGEETPDSAE